MTTDWESLLRSWAKPPSENEDQKRDTTESQIREALKVSPAMSDKGYKVYVKGSYANKTNVRLDYDVDIAVQCTDFYYFDKTGAAADVKKAAVIENLKSWSQRYTRHDFRSSVSSALVDYFGSKAVTEGNIALRIREKKTTLPADVVPCFEYHYIWDVSNQGQPKSYEGARIYPNKGDHIHNWPNQQLTCGNAKNDATGRRYKRMVRILKRIENQLVKANVINELPSFFMECLVYNVPNEKFNNATYVEDINNVVADICTRTSDATKCAKWLEANERKYLFHSSQPWTVKQAHELCSYAQQFLSYP
jgi:hypothetical protein